MTTVPQHLNKKKTESWICPNKNCGFLNKSKRHDCAACRTVRPMYQQNKHENKEQIADSLQEHWLCQKCDKLNKGVRLTCVFCHASRSSKNNDDANDQSSSHTKFKDDILHDADKWVCDNCEFLNRGKRTLCQQCHYKRIDKPKKNINISNTNEKVETFQHIRKTNNNNTTNNNQSISNDINANIKTNKSNNVDNYENDLNQDMWQCASCTLINKSSNDVCEVCGAPKLKSQNQST